MNAGSHCSGDILIAIGANWHGVSDSEFNAGSHCSGDILIAIGANWHGVSDHELKCGVPAPVMGSPQRVPSTPPPLCICLSAKPVCACGGDYAAATAASRIPRRCHEVPYGMQPPRQPAFSSPIGSNSPRTCLRPPEEPVAPRQGLRITSVVRVVARSEFTNTRNAFRHVHDHQFGLKISSAYCCFRKSRSGASFSR